MQEEKRSGPLFWGVMHGDLNTLKERDLYKGEEIVTGDQFHHVRECRGVWSGE